jgi:transcriptional regulator with XRE-family HTH domain
MRIHALTSDTAVLGELGQRLARWRLERNLSQAAFAKEAGVGARTVQRLEAGESVQLTNLVRVLRALGLLDALDRLVPEPPPSPIDRLRTAGRERQRAGRSAARSEPARPAPWAWGDEGEDA